MKARHLIFGTAVMAVSGLGLAGHALAGTATTPNLSAAQGADLASVVKAQTPAQRQTNLAQLPTDQRAGVQAQLDQITNDQIAVSDHAGFRGYISARAYASMVLPRSTADLYPVTDTEGNTVAFWGGGGVGVLDKTLVESGIAIDYAAIRNSHPHMR